MADDDEIRKIIQATGGGEYNARLGEYGVSFFSMLHPLPWSWSSLRRVVYPTCPVFAMWGVCL